MDGKSLLLAALGLTGAAAGTAAVQYGQHKQTSSLNELEVRLASAILEVNMQNQRISLLEKLNGSAHPTSNAVQSGAETSKLRSRIAQLEARVKNLEDDLADVIANSEVQEYQPEPSRPPQKNRPAARVPASTRTLQQPKTQASRTPARQSTVRMTDQHPPVRQSKPQTNARRSVPQVEEIPDDDPSDTEDMYDDNFIFETSVRHD